MIFVDMVNVLNKIKTGKVSWFMDYSEAVKVFKRLEAW